MKVFDLVCEHGHVFEGWFDSTEAFESQQSGGMGECPTVSYTHLTLSTSDLV